MARSLRRLQSRETNIEDVKIFLIIMYSSPNSRDGSDIVATVLEAAKSLDEIFCALSKYGLWDYINYYLLQSIIEEFASDDHELNRMMTQYQKDLTGYILTLQIQTYLDATNHPFATTSDSKTWDNEIVTCTTHELFRKLSAKCDVNITDHTLSYVYDLWRSLANQFLLPQPAMILHDIAEGCICITWLIPANLVKHVTIMARETANMFDKENIVKVMLEERCIYLMETKPPLPETEPSLLKCEGVFYVAFIFAV